MEKLPPLIRALLIDPACYDHPVGKLELVETHISWVLLTGLYAYKIRKPVNLGFLDFSTLALREQDCIDELRLNRRLAADIYLDVVAISGSIDAPRINGAGGVLEYAVKMRQFPVDTTLDHFSARGELNEVHIDALAARLAHFHLAECELAPDDSQWGEPDVIARPVAENFKLLALNDPAQSQCLSDLQSWCETEHSRLAPLMTDRKKNGRVRECHGDLHLANLAWVNGQLVIFDCLEFSPALRWIDVISEVAFCYMDLLHRQHADLASRFLNAWLEATGDYQGVALLRYYAVYRALVRAKVAALRAGQLADKTLSQSAHTEVTGCLQLAEQLALSTRHSPLSTPLSLTITHGLSGSGKTTHSQRMLEKHGMIRLRSDVERKRLAGLDALANEHGKDVAINDETIHARSPLLNPLPLAGEEVNESLREFQVKSGVGEGLYTRQSSRHTYEHLAHLAEELLKAGWPVIVDAAFLERDQRDLFRDLAKRLGATFLILDIQADPAILRERVSRRVASGCDASEADLRVLQHQLATAQPLGDDELSVATQISGMDDLIKLV